MLSGSSKGRLITKANLLVSQFRSENETWNRTLESLTEEDLSLKTRLSEILKNMGQRNDGLLGRIEHFHNRLLKVNETIGFLRLELNKIEKKLSQVFSVNIEDTLEVRHLQKKLRKEMEIVEFEFHILKFELNNFICEVLQTLSKW